MRNTATQPPVHDGPSHAKAFMFVACVRIAAAQFSPISDCDETFNYWEPLHMLVFGSGQQTWEYSPQYALRSYFYIWIHALPTKAILFLTGATGVDKIQIFVAVRILLGLFSAFCEVELYQALCARFRMARVPLFYLIFIACNAGMFSAGVAFLPSSFAMGLVTLSLARAMQHRYFETIAWMTLAIFAGWPFCGLLALPLAVLMIYDGRSGTILRLVQHSLSILPVVLGAMYFVDSHYYGKPVLPWLNIVLYNVFGVEGGSSTLYGVEPWHFYLKNGLMNFNIVLPLALMAPLMPFVGGYYKRLGGGLITAYLMISPFFLWFIFMSLQPHKEERFLFVVYPIICFAAAFSAAILCRLFSEVFSKRGFGSLETIFEFMFFAISGAVVILSFIRLAAVINGYQAPNQVYRSLSEDITQIGLRSAVVCVGKEWYRFPNSFYLPEGTQLAYLKSDFRGLLPQSFNTTSSLPLHFNNLNKEEPSRYVQLSTCDYIVDLDAPWQNEEHYTQNENYTLVTTKLFLDAIRSPFPMRSIYIPLYSRHTNVYADYVLLRRKSIQGKPPPVKKRRGEKMSIPEL